MPNPKPLDLVAMKKPWQILLFSAFFILPCHAQTAPDEQLPATDTSPQSQSDADMPPHSPAVAPQPQPPPEGVQPKRILWIIPNYRAVSASVQLPRASRKDKLWLATQDSFDYSSFLLAGIVAGLSQAKKNTPQFGDGAAAVISGIASPMKPSAIILPRLFFPLSPGRTPATTLSAVAADVSCIARATRLPVSWITRNDSGKNTFNSSEVAGNALGAGLSDLYYPAAERTLSQTGQKWVLQLGLDALFNVTKEFWPDIDNHIFRGYYGADH